MIGKLTGIVITTNSNPVILDVHDVGYSVNITETCRKNISTTKPVSLFIHSHIRDDAFDLYGFADEQELALFELLLTVSGVGPKTALNVMDQGSALVNTAVRTNDVDFFTRVPRLGKKNAQKIIIELKNKIGGTEDLDLNAHSEKEELTDALQSMGFGKNEIAGAIELLKDSREPIDTKIRLALKHLGKRT